MISDRALDITPLGALPGFCLLTRVATERAGRGYLRDVARRARSNGIMQLTLAGCGWCRSGGGTPLPVPVGTAMVFHTRLHQELVYGMPEGGTWDFLYTDLDGEAARGCLGDLVAQHGHVIPLDPAHPAVRACAALLPRQPLAHRSMPAVESARLGGNLLLALAEGIAVGEDALVVAAMAWLRGRLGRQVAIEACAAALGVSREHLTRRFARHTGDSPARWLVRQRLAHACVLLAAPDARVEQVAGACGFATPAHFAAVFRSRFGLSPLAWRRQRPVV